MVSRTRTISFKLVQEYVIVRWLSLLTVKVTFVAVVKENWILARLDKAMTEIMATTSKLMKRLFCMNFKARTCKT